HTVAAPTSETITTGPPRYTTIGDSAQDAADGLDPEVIAMPIDEGDHFVVGWSSSLAKNTEAAFKISLARRDSASSRRSLRFSSSRDTAGLAEGSAGP